ncbi:MAG: hypothetical protein J5808_01700 [Paludibacteraceae bacterium]|nr:hypothetical protein [Paludibacteraceae bacterium]
MKEFKHLNIKILATLAAMVSGLTSCPHSQKSNSESESAGTPDIVSDSTTIENEAVDSTIIGDRSQHGNKAYYPLNILLFCFGDSTIVMENMDTIFAKEKSANFLFAKVVWYADFEPKKEDVEYREFINWSKKHLLIYAEIPVDTADIHSWNDIRERNAKNFNEIINSDEANSDYEYSILQDVVLHREKSKSYTNHTILSATEGSLYGVHGYYLRYTASFSNTTGERFAWDCIADVDGLLSKLDKRYLAGYLEDTETWASIDTVVDWMKNNKPWSDPYLKETTGGKYLCLFYQIREVEWRIPHHFEMSIPLDTVIPYLNDKGKKFL